MMNDYETKYKSALAKAKKLVEFCTNAFERKSHIYRIEEIESLFPELSRKYRILESIIIYLDWLDGRKDYEPKGEFTIRQMIDFLTNIKNENCNA